MVDWFTEFMDDDPLIKGVIFILVGVGYLIYKVGKVESFNMRDYSAGGWKALVSSWAIIFMLLICGMILIIQNL